MPDPVADYLRSLNTSDRARAAAWDAVYTQDDATAQRTLQQLPFSNEVRANLWDLRQGGTLSGTPPPATPARAEDFAPNTMPAGSAVGRFVSNAGEILNPVTAVQGLAHAVAHPLDTATSLYNASADQAQKAAAAYRAGQYGEAIGHGLGAIPFIGPPAAAAGEQIASGDVAGGLGKGAALLATAGVAGPAARLAGRIAEPVAESVAGKLYQSALKPTKAVLNDVRVPSGAGADAARDTLVQTGLREAIPVSARGARKVENLIDSLNAEVQQRLSAATHAGKTVDPTHVEAIIRDVAKDFTDQINAQPDLAAIETVRQNFVSNPNVARTVQGPAGAATVQQDIPVDVAQRMKTNTYRGLRGKYGVERGATIEAEKAGARGLREGIEQAAPDVKDLNAREGSLFPLEQAIADAMRRRGNYGIFGLTPVVASLPAVANGHFLPLMASLVDRMPGVVSRTGIWINRIGKGSGRVGAVAGRAVAAGNLTNPSESRSQTRGPASLVPQSAQ